MATDLTQTQPTTLAISVQQYRVLVEQGTFDGLTGQIELIYGRITRMNPQGPVHSDPIDELEDWSHAVAGDVYRIRIEKPLEIPQLDSTPEPDVAWVTRQRYAHRHPLPTDVHLLVEVSHSSLAFDRGEKARLYSEAGIAEYWIVDVPEQVIEVFTQPQSTGYGQRKVYKVGDALCPLCLPGATLLVARLFSDRVG